MVTSVSVLEVGDWGDGSGYLQLWKGGFHFLSVGSFASCFPVTVKKSLFFWSVLKSY